MENQIPTNTPETMSQMPPSTPTPPDGMDQKSETKSGAGALIGSIIIILILIIGGIYFFSKLKNVEAPAVSDVQEASNDELESEVDAAFDTNIDNELNAIEAEMDAALVE